MLGILKQMGHEGPRHRVRSSFIVRVERAFGLPAGLIGDGMSDNARASWTEMHHWTENEVRRAEGIAASLPNNGRSLFLTTAKRLHTHAEHWEMAAHPRLPGKCQEHLIVTLGYDRISRQMIQGTDGHWCAVSSETEHDVHICECGEKWRTPLL